jgi:hypothetical protein
MAKKGSTPPIKPGQPVKESGIYKDTRNNQRTTLEKGLTAPPTSKPGDKWKMEIPTDPKKREEHKGQVSPLPFPSCPS